MRVTKGGASNRPDPILAAIERHRLADVAVDTAIADDAEGAKERIMQAETRALRDLLEVVPTTMRGIWALCDHLAEYGTREQQWAEMQDSDGRQLGVKLLENIRDAIERIERDG